VLFGCRDFGRFIQTPPFPPFGDTRMWNNHFWNGRKRIGRLKYYGRTMLVRSRRIEQKWDHVCWIFVAHVCFRNFGLLVLLINTVKFFLVSGWWYLHKTEGSFMIRFVHMPILKRITVKIDNFQNHNVRMKISLVYG